MANISQRLRRLENDAATLLQRQPLCTAYIDGTAETRKFLPLLFETYEAYEAGEPLPKVNKVTFHFDTAKNGKLPELLLYMLSL